MTQWQHVTLGEGANRRAGNDRQAARFERLRNLKWAEAD